MKTILVVDDEVSIQTLLKDILELNGFKVMITDDGTEVVSICRNQDISLIILDMMMPKATGHEIYTSLKIALKAEGLENKVPPAIILTAHPGAENTQFLLMTESGVEKLIPKPFQIDELLESVKATIKKYDK